LIALAVTTVLCGKSLTSHGEEVDSTEGNIGTSNECSHRSSNILPANFLVVEEVVGVLVICNIASLCPSKIPSGEGRDTGSIGPAWVRSENAGQDKDLKDGDQWAGNIFAGNK